MGNAFLKRINYILGTSQKLSIETILLITANKESGDGKCIMYNGTRSNNAMIRPLLKDLIDYLHIDDTNYDSDLGDGGIIEIDPDAEENIKELWNKTTICTDIPKVNFEVICPSSYVYGNYLKMNLYSVSILIFIVLFII